MLIESKHNQKIKDVIKLANTKSLRDKQGLIVFEGEHYLDFINDFENLLITIYTTNLSYVNNKCEVIYLTNDVYQKISFFNNSKGILFITKKPIFNNSLTNKIIYLDNVQDPGNMGTILRTALAFNFVTIILSDDCVDIYNEKVIRSSKGSIFKLNLIQNKNSNFLKELKNEGYHLLTTTLDGKENPTKNFNKLCVIFGNEGSGVSKEIINLTDEKLTIKMFNDVESLNVGVAAGIILNSLK